MNILILILTSIGLISIYYNVIKILPYLLKISYISSICVMQLSILYSVYLYLPELIKTYLDFDILEMDFIVLNDYINALTEHVPFYLLKQSAI